MKRCRTSATSNNQLRPTIRTVKPENQSIVNHLTAAKANCPTVQNERTRTAQHVLNCQLKAVLGSGNGTPPPSNAVHNWGAGCVRARGARARGVGGVVGWVTVQRYTKPYVNGSQPGRAERQVVQNEGIGQSGMGGGRFACSVNELFCQYASVITQTQAVGPANETNAKRCERTKRRNANQ